MQAELYFHWATPGGTEYWILPPGPGLTISWRYFCIIDYCTSRLSLSLSLSRLSRPSFIAFRLPPPHRLSRLLLNTLRPSLNCHCKIVNWSESRRSVSGSLRRTDWWNGVREAISEGWACQQKAEESWLMGRSVRSKNRRIGTSAEGWLFGGSVRGNIKSWVCQQKAEAGWLLGRSITGRNRRVGTWAES